jgi:tRNA dimethylallyltransferase
LTSLPKNSKRKLQKRPLEKPRVIVVLGPTSSGKSELAVKLARRFNGEVVSADSRQVYRGLDIGAGKVPISYESSHDSSTKSSIPNFRKKGGIPVYKGIRHHLLDVANPKRTFTVAQFQKLGEKALRDILRRGKVPIVCGGTGFYIDALLSGTLLPEVKPNPKLRAKLYKLSTLQLFTKLKTLDPARAASIDPHNKRRLVRALEIILATGKPVPKPSAQESKYDVLKIGIKTEKETLNKKIAKRLRARLRQGMIEEVKKLRAQGVPVGRSFSGGLSWKRLDELGLEYRYVSRYLRGLLAYDEMVKTLENEIRKYAKRQMTWFKRDKNTHWVRTEKAALGLAKNFLASVSN